MALKSPKMTNQLRRRVYEPSKDATFLHPELDDTTFVIEEHGPKEKDLNASPPVSISPDDDGSVPPGGADSFSLIGDPHYHPEYSPLDNTNNLNSGHSHPASERINAAAIVVPILIVLIFITGLTVFCVRPCSRAKKARTAAHAQVLASDLETGAVPPRVLSPSTVPTQAPREHQRGWLFMPQLGVPNWIRGYRRRSDPRHADDPDWQLDVNEVGDAPPEYSGPSPQEEKVEAEATSISRTATNATDETLPGYQALEESQGASQDEVHPRDEGIPTEERGNDVGDAGKVHDERSGN